MNAKYLDSDYDIFMHNVAWLRKKHGFTKKKMAALMGIGIESLNKIEKGVFPKNLKVDAIINIQKSFGVSPATLLTKRLEE